MRPPPTFLLAVLLAGCAVRNPPIMRTTSTSAGEAPEPMWLLHPTPEFVTDTLGPSALETCRVRLAAGAEGCSANLGPCATLVVDKALLNEDDRVMVTIGSCSGRPETPSAWLVYGGGTTEKVPF